MNLGLSRQSIRQRIDTRAAVVVEQDTEQFAERGWCIAPVAVVVADAVQQRPLAAQGRVGPEKGPRWVVHVRRFARRSIQLDDGQILASQEFFDLRVTNVETSDEETDKVPGDGVHGPL